MPMEQQKITVVIGNKTYNFHPGDTQAIREIPSTERQQLIALLEAVKQQENLADIAVRDAIERARNLSPMAPGTISGRAPPEHPATKPERLGSGDVDALMARLVMEEKNNRKPALNSKSIYKLLIGFAVVVFLLVLIV